MSLRGFVGSASTIPIWSVRYWLAAERRGLVRIDAAFAVQVKNGRIVGQ